jgi:hypothetical protein
LLVHTVGVENSGPAPLLAPLLDVVPDEEPDVPDDEPLEVELELVGGSPSPVSVAPPHAASASRVVPKAIERAERSSDMRGTSWKGFPRLGGTAAGR